MFNFFKKKKIEKRLQIVDLNGEPIAEGDAVKSLRYDLGQCIVIETESGLAYESIESKKIVHWTKMIDATTERQKVYKI